MRSSASTRPACAPGPASPARASRGSAASWGLGPAEFFAGIPGTLGGALAMNAGAFGGETWRHVRERRDHRPRAATRAGAPPPEYRIGYRQVQAPGGRGVVRRRASSLSSAAPAPTRGEVRALLERRRETQPIGEWSCGSVFTNPPGDHAARLIEAAGSRGFRIGDASVSEKHANFIINHGEASAADLERLIAHVQRHGRARARRRAAPRGAHRGSAVSHAPELRAAAGSSASARRASSGASRCCSAGTRASARSRCSRATRCSTRSSAAASMRTPSIRATAPLAELIERALRARLDRAARPGRRGRHAAGGARVPRRSLHRQRRAWARPSAWTSCAPSAWRSPRACRPPTSWCCADAADFELALERLELPLIVKPATQGSSVGMTKVERAAELPAAYAAAAQLEPLVFAEAWLPGAEYTVAHAAGRGAALDPHRDAADLLRLRGEVLPRRHALLLPRGLGARPRRRIWQQPGARGLRGLPAPAGWGRADFMMDAAAGRCCSRSTPSPA